MLANSVSGLKKKMKSEERWSKEVSASMSVLHRLICGQGAFESKNKFKLDELRTVALLFLLFDFIS